MNQLTVEKNNDQALEKPNIHDSKVNSAESFKPEMVLDNSKKTYIEQSAPQLKAFLDKVLDRNSIDQVSKHCVNFLSGRYRHGFFVDDLALVAKELGSIGLKDRDISKLVERAYGPLNPDQNQQVATNLQAQKEYLVDRSRNILRKDLGQEETLKKEIGKFLEERLLKNSGMPTFILLSEVAQHTSQLGSKALTKLLDLGRGRELAGMFKATVEDPDAYILGHDLYVSSFKSLRAELKTKFSVEHNPSALHIRLFAHEKAMELTKSAAFAIADSLKNHQESPGEVKKTLESNPREEKISKQEAAQPSIEKRPVDLCLEFGRVLADSGLVVESIVADSKWQRVPVASDKSGKKSGSYWLDPATGVGYIQNFKTGESKTWTIRSQNPAYTPTSTSIFTKSREIDLETKQRQEQVAQYCSVLWAKLIETKDHPYLEKKNIASFGLKTTADGSLAIPLKDIDDKIWSLQFITDTKRFVKGGKKAGCFFPIGDYKTSEQIYIAEGYATAATIFSLTQKPVIVAFDAGNLKTVALSIRERYPNKAIIFAADNDQHLLAKIGVNPGVAKAMEAARLVNADTIIPNFDAKHATERDPPTDFNDLARLLGQSEAKRQLEVQL